MKTLRTTLRILALAVIAIFASCTKDNESAPVGGYSNGIFIVNEGPFQTGTGTITFYNPDSNLVKQDIFEAVNGRPLGNIAQSITVYNDKAYIVVNNAGKVEVVNAATFKSEGTITNLNNPSQFIIVDSKKAYISDWIGQVTVVDLQSNSVTNNIAVGTGPDVMLKSGNYVYVANSGGLGIDSTISVIDFSTDKVVKTIKVGDAPSGLVADLNGRIWVLCKGKGFTGWPQAGDTQGKLIRIDPTTLYVDYTYNFVSTDVHPEKLVINKQKAKLYFLYNYGIYGFNLETSSPMPEQLVSRYFYSLGYQNETGYLYASDAKDYVNNGIVLRIKADDGSVVDSILAGIIPRAFAFPE
ncbi:MAG: YncE family protein [Bacteroidales bacterium]